MRQCPVNNCGVRIDPSMFACKQHWFWLTPPQRARVNEAYTLYLAGKLTVEQLRVRQQEVIDEVAEAGQR